MKEAVHKINRFSRRSYRCVASRIKRNQALVLLVVALATLSACAPLVEVRQVNPKLGALDGRSSELQRAERAVADAENIKHTDPTKAVGLYIYLALNLHPARCGSIQKIAWPCVITTSLCHACFPLFRDVYGMDPWTRPLDVRRPIAAKYGLIQRPNANRLWRPQDFDLIPAEELDVRGKLVVPRVAREGAGAPLVAVRSEQAPPIRQRFVPPRVYLAVTAVAHFSGRKCEIEFIDPLSVEITNISKRSEPASPRQTLLRHWRWACRASIRRKLVYRRCSTRTNSLAVFASSGVPACAIPKKIPVLFVHGLQSTPASWALLEQSAIWADPVLRRNYLPGLGVRLPDRLSYPLLSPAAPGASSTRSTKHSRITAQSW